MPAAAMMPAWRMPPPSIFRARRARPMKSRLPVTTEPTGAPSPLERQKVTESAWAATSFAGIPVATHAFQRRAPSRWTARPCSVAIRRISLQRRQRVHGSAATVVRVLDADERVFRIVDVRLADGVAHLGGVQDAMAASQCARLDGREDRQPRHLVVEDMGVLVQDDLVAPLRVGHQGDLVPLSPRRHEEAGLLPQSLGGERLQPRDRGVLRKHVVADLGLGHGPPHLGGRLRHRVAAKVNNLRGTAGYHDALLFVP